MLTEKGNRPLDHSAAIYMRLSRDDGNDRSESESIVSQRMLLTQYASRNHLNIISEFVDDGISGLRWDRPALQEMLRAAGRGWIRTILVKDLSRLSRDYVRIGELIEYWFPAHGIRLISVNDGVDTCDRAACNDFSPFKALMNDWYTRDISRKVRAAISARQQAGICTLATIPYGYIRKGNQLIVNSEQGKVIRGIFSRYLDGLSCVRIAAELTGSGFSSPRHADNGWSDATVRRMLMNPVYAGKLLLRKTELISYKCKKNRQRSPDEAICFSVPAIISAVQFADVQRRMKLNRHRKTVPHWLSGLAGCGECGARMIVTGQRLICAGRRRKNGCRNGSLRVEALETEICHAMTDAGIQIGKAALPFFVESVRITQKTADVQLWCRHPDESVPKE